MKLEYLMTMHATIQLPPVTVGGGPFGNRLIFHVKGGAFEGPRLKGTVDASGADWALFDAKGVGRLDVRVLLNTADGAAIYSQYAGVLMMNDKTNQALASGGSTAFGDTYFMTQIRFETGHENYLWLNETVAVGEGRLIPGGVEYKVYAVVND